MSHALQYAIHQASDVIPPKFTPLSDRFQRGCNERWWGQQATAQTAPPPAVSHDTLVAQKKLIKQILTFGGAEVCMPDLEEDCQKIANRGCFLYGDKANKVTGRPSRCHENSAIMWDRARDQYQIMTGYALSQDGLWRQHTWCMCQTTGYVQESTESRLAYYGFVLSEEEAEDFVFDNAY